MKKRLLFLMMLMLVTLAGCGANKENDVNNTDNNSNTEQTQNIVLESTKLSEVPVEKFVTLGEYKGLKVSVKEAKVDKTEKEQLFQQVYYSYINEESGVTDRAVKMGDTVNIDYEGKKDGVAFSGGTASNQQLGIGSGSFIAGFEDGLVGVKPGETVDLNLTFPKDYQSQDLAGQAVVFTVKVNFIYPEYDDATVASWGETAYTNVAEMEEYIQEYLQLMADSTYESDLENAVIKQFVSNCSFTELPNELVERFRNSLRDNLETEAASYGMDVESFSQYAYGMLLADLLDSYAKESTKQMLALQAVANAEGLNKTDEELEKSLQEAAAEAEMASVEEYLGDSTREDYKEYLMFENTIAFLVENAVVTKQ